jgi:hypothetical protein
MGVPIREMLGGGRGRDAIIHDTVLPQPMKWCTVCPEYLISSIADT